MTKAISIPILADDSRQVVRVDRATPLPAIPIATDASGNIMAEAVPYRHAFDWGYLDGFVVRLRAIVAGMPMIRDSENVYASLDMAEDAYWADCEAARFAEKRIIEWEAWEPAVVMIAAE